MDFRRPLPGQLSVVRIVSISFTSGHLPGVAVATPVQYSRNVFIIRTLFYLEIFPL